MQQGIIKRKILTGYTEVLTPLLLYILLYRLSKNYLLNSSVDDKLNTRSYILHLWLRIKSNKLKQPAMLLHPYGRNTLHTTQFQ